MPISDEGYPEQARQEQPRSRVLIVDDDDRNLLALTEVLHDIADIVPVRSGEEALRELLRGSFAVIVLDVLMPGLDGYETANLIRAREQSRDVPIIFLTAINKEDAHLLRGYDTGAVDYVFKPFEPIVVRSKVSVFVALHEKTVEIERKASTEQRLLEGRLQAERERNRALEELRISEQRQELVLNALPIAVYSMPEAHETPSFVAGNIRALTGFLQSEFEANPDLWSERIHPDDVKRGGNSDGLLHTSEYRWLHADGTYRHFWDQAVPLQDGTGYAGILRDVSEQRNMQHQLMQAQKMEALGKLTGGIAHDFNNLLASVLSGLSLIERRSQLDARATELLLMTRHSAEQGRHLVSRLLTFSRRQPLMPKVVEPETLPGSLGSMLEPLLGGVVKVSWNLGPGLWRSYVDMPQLELVIMNLVLNARDAMPDGGTVTICIENCHVAVRDDLLPGDYLKLTIADTGTGIPDELLPRVVEPFFTTKDVGKGTGLGLSMAYGFAKESGGTLSIRSKVGEGTEVALWLPRSHVELAPAAKGNPDHRDDSRARRNRILLVDDSPSLRALTEMQLQDDGYAVTATGGGEDALALIERDPDAFDAIVTDLAMPTMSGLELIRRARRLKSNYPAVIITGYADGPRLSERPANVELVLKPFGAEQLDRALQNVLRDRTDGWAAQDTGRPS